MASICCPACAHENTRQLKKLSPDDKVQYHHCDGCGHVWVTFKDGRPTHHVTPLYDRPSKRHEAT